MASAAFAQTPLPPPYNYDEPLPTRPHPLPDWQLLTLGEAAHTYRIPVYANRKLDGALKNIERVVIVLPSARRNSGRHYQDIAPLVARDAAAKTDTLVLALEFPTAIDPHFADLPAWRKASWETGGLSIRASGRPAPVSAFAVLDDIVRWLADAPSLPTLSHIVLAAHGDGAQLLQRYAVLNGIDDAIRRKGIDLRYVVANAASYMYLTDERPRRHGAGYASYERGICPTYHQYPYGAQQLPDYADSASLAELYVRYASRDVVYLLGSADNNPEDHELDKQCGAEAQGSTRLSRGMGYINYDPLRAQRRSPPVGLAHQAQRVIGVGHDAAAIFASQCASQALFGPQASLGDRAAACQAMTPHP